MGFKNLNVAHEKALDGIKRVIKNGIFDKQCQIVDVQKTHPDQTEDTEVTITVTGREKDIHAVESMCFLSYRVKQWKL